jgi:hypothetical protein|tara:strand:+ start:312 stop:476 length:165 start_codon:yes stop_codon:yes gene_type:complete
MSKDKKNASYHIKNNYKKYVSVNGYKFWAKDKEDARKYCKQMNWVIGDLSEKEE